MTCAWDLDALTCEGCGARMKFIAVIKDRGVIKRILQHIGEDAEEPLVREGARSIRRVSVKGRAGAARATRGKESSARAARLGD